MAARKLSHFELLSDLSNDAIGSLHLARDLSRERTVFLRAIPAAAFPSEKIKRRFVEHTLALSRISHSNVATVYGVEEVDGVLAVVCEAAEGEPLSRKIGELGVSEARDILRQILGGLDAAHSSGVLHGALSPESVFVTQDGSLKLVSFGSAPLVEAWLDSGAETPGVSGDDLRLLAYLSPEAVKNDELDARADLWSVGVIAHEMLSRTRPFDGEDAPSIVFSILNGGAFGELKDRSDIPGDTKRLVLQLLRKDPEERPSSPVEAVACLEARPSDAWPANERLPLAVMYFAGEGAADGNSHVAVALAEDVISRISRVSGVAVTTRHDVLAFKGRDVDAIEFGRCMGVAAVLTGSVQAIGGAVRVAVRLAAVKSGRGVWNETFERRASEVPALGGEIARSALEALGRTVSAEAANAVEGKATNDPRAYDFYARGRELMTHRGRRHTEAAMRMFRFAISCDPDMAAAHESLGSAYSGMFTYYDGAEVWLDRMAEASRRALELDAGLIEARLQLAMVLFHRKDYDGARRALKGIIEQRPDCYEAYRWLGILSDITERYDEALDYYYMSARIKPCSVEPWLYVNMTHRRRGDLDAAMKAAEKFLEVGLKTLRIGPDDPVTLSRFCVVYTLFDEKGKARDALNRILASGTEDGLVLYNCAATYALLGDEAMSLECLGRALAGGYKNVREWIENDPDFAEIRESAEFRELLSEFDLQHERRGR